MPHRTLGLQRLLKPALLVLFISLAGCAQDQGSSYTGERESTLSDAQNKARGRHARAPSQVQLGFGDSQKQREQQAAPNETEASEAAATTRAASIPPLRDVKTFLGTLPCTQATANCVASR